MLAENYEGKVHTRELTSFRCQSGLGVSFSAIYRGILQIDIQSMLSNNNFLREKNILLSVIEAYFMMDLYINNNPITYINSINVNLD